MSVVRALALTVLLAGPTVIAFFAGGYFDQPREWAGIFAWALVVVAALASPAPLPRAWPARLAVLGLAALAALTALSLVWTPLGGATQDDAQRVALYLGTLIAAAALVRGRAAIRCVEPALAAGTVIVVGYGVSGRLLPDLIELSASRTAFGRLEQPLTYWNAMGALATFGLVLCARLAGDGERDPRARALAAAAAAPLGLGVYLSFSRAALVALAVGLIVLVALRPDRRQARGALTVLAAGIAAAVAGALLPAVRALEGSGTSRTTQGLIMLAVLLAVMAAAAAAVARRPRRDPETRLRLPRPRWIIAFVVLLLAGGTLLAAASDPRAGNPATGANTARLASVESNRYAYWRVAAGEFTTHPLLGVGSGAFRVDWLRERTVDDPAKDAHSLYVETLAELGLLGLAALAAFLAGVAISSVRAFRAAPARAAGPAAALTVWAVHTGLDWDWEMPAVTTPALIAAGLLVALSDGGLSSRREA